MADSPKFVVANEQDIHTWAMFSLVERTVVSPQGEPFVRKFVHTPGAVATVAITADSEVLFVTQYRATFDDFILEIPAGMRDVDGEDPAETARRELKEETGYSASTIQFLGTCLSSPGVTDSVVDVYLATGLVAGDSEPHGPEEDSMTLTRIPFVDALAMVEDGQLTDAKSAYGLMLAARRFPHLVR